jgi:calcineurin-like phosphoesterase
MPSSFDVASKDARLEGLLVVVDEKTGKATRLKRIREKIADASA